MRHPFDFWDLGGQAERDQARHRQKVAESIKQRLGDIIAHESIISAPDGSVVRIRVPEKRDPRLRLADPARGAGREGVGAGPGEGDILTVPGGGQGPGSGHAEPGVAVDVPIDELAAWLFEELRLPRLTPRDAGDPESLDRLVARGPTGVVLDRKRSLLEHLKRDLAAPPAGPDGEPAGATRTPWSRHDLVWRRWHEVAEPVTRAVVVLVRDASGSITEEMRYVIRAACFWIVRWLRRSYRHVALRFVIHDTEAREVDEATFLSVGVMGGTYISSGLAEAGRILSAEYPRAGWNRYVVFFTDGDNFPADNARLGSAALALAGEVELLAMGLLGDGREPAELRALQQSPSFARGRLRSPQDLAAWLRSIFGGKAA
jgi:uncharacterized sporulation protein YeaH/YhbH (DUF444 family)